MDALSRDTATADLVVTSWNLSSERRFAASLTLAPNWAPMLWATRSKGRVFYNDLDLS